MPTIRNLWVRLFDANQLPSATRVLPSAHKGSYRGLGLVYDAFRKHLRFHSRVSGGPGAQHNRQRWGSRHLSRTVKSVRIVSPGDPDDLSPWFGTRLL